MIPLARELIKNGTFVVLAANEVPALNDITAPELKVCIRCMEHVQTLMLHQHFWLCPILHFAPAKPALPHMAGCIPNLCLTFSATPVGLFAILMIIRGLPANARRLLGMS